MSRQIFAVSALNIRNIPARAGASLVTVVGMAGVVGVFIALMAMAQGFEATITSTGKPDRFLILRQGSTLELNGSIQADVAAVLRELPGIAHTASGNPAITGETYVSVNMRRRGVPEDGNVPLRGVGPTTFDVRDEAHIVAGRNMEWGKFELVAGVAAASAFESLAIGDVVTVHGASWTVVGHFSTGNTAQASELWGDVTLVNTVFGRGNTFSSMTGKLEDGADIGALHEQIANDKRLIVDVHAEDAYYAAQSRGTAELIRTVGLIIAGIMALGAIFAALNTMYVAVSSRTTEIATLRALGFSRASIILSVLTEALLLAMMGAVLGAGMVWLGLNGYTASTMGSTYMQVAFAFGVTLELIGAGILLGCTLGMFGGLLPAIKAIRIDMVEGLAER